MSEKQEKLCPKCKTGKKDYELDNKSIFCTYIDRLNNGICSMFEPLKTNTSEKI